MKEVYDNPGSLRSVMVFHASIISCDQLISSKTIILFESGIFSKQVKILQGCLQGMIAVDKNQGAAVDLPV